MSASCDCGRCEPCLARDDEYVEAMVRNLSEDPTVEAEFAPTTVRDGDLLLMGRRGAVDDHGYLWMQETYGGLEIR